MAEVRKATLGDAQAIFALWLGAKVSGPYATVQIDRARAFKSIRQCISGPQAFARVATEDDGALVGALLGLKEELWFSPRAEAKDLLFVANDAAVAEDLLHWFTQWAWSHPRVISVLMAIPEGAPLTNAFRARGFVREGSVYTLGRWDIERSEVA